jgi:glutamate-5-semialdehyde dehydrogenase
MATATSTVADTCRAARRAARALAQCDTRVKDAALAAVAHALRSGTAAILEANDRDMRAGEQDEIGDALLDRLRLDEARIEGIARAVEDIAALPDPVGEVIEDDAGHRLELRKVRAPRGVVAVVYEARPNASRSTPPRWHQVRQRDRPARPSTAAHSNAGASALRVGVGGSARGCPRAAWLWPAGARGAGRAGQPERDRRGDHPARGEG